MAVLLSCTMSDRIAAVGLVAAAHFLPLSACKDERAVTMIAFHGTDDRFTPYHGGTSWVARGHVFPSIPTFTANWARRNRCAAGPAETRVAADVTRWPGGGPTPEWFVGSSSNGVDATRETWAFFRAHPLAKEPTER